METVFETSAYRWVPWRAWPEFEREFHSAQQKLGHALDAFDTDFDAIRKTVLETFAQLAADSALRLQATGQPVPADFQDAVVRGVLDALAVARLCTRTQMARRWRMACTSSPASPVS
jgi:hypothetical protein